MEAHEAIDKIKTALTELQSKGQNFVHIPSLAKLLDALGKSATPAAEMRKFQHESGLAWYQAQWQG